MNGQLGTILGRGKTKIIHATSRPDQVDLEATEDITAGDGKKHDQLEGKARLATHTTCNVFQLLQDFGISNSFIRRVNETTFRAWKTEMIPFEVVGRRLAYGSYLEREPDTEKLHRFEPVLVEFYLKTTGKKWRDHTIPVDDPFVKDTGDGTLELYDPHKPLAGQVPFLVIADDFSTPLQRGHMSYTTSHAFEVIERAWQRVGGTLVDIKFEFGTSSSGDLLLSDVVDNDSWRVIYGGEDVSKQAYREGAALPTVKGKYELVASLTDRF